MSSDGSPSGARLGVALIGAGRMGRVHGRRLAELPECQVRKVLDTSLDRARQLADSLGAEGTTLPEDVLDDSSVEAVLVVTPAPTHAEWVVAAARAGKAVFVEKPIAESLPAGGRVVEAVERAGIQAQVGFQRRYDPAYRRALERIEAGDLGRVEGFRAVGRDPFPPPLDYLVSSGDLLADMGSHDLDSARFLVGEVDEVYAVGGALAVPELAQHDLSDTAVATLRFANGAVGTLEVALRTAYGYDIRAEVLGEKGRIHVEMDRRYDLLFYGRDGGAFERPRNFEERFSVAYAAELTAFVRNVRAGRPVSPTPRDAVMSLRLALAAQHSLDTRTVVNVRDFGRQESRS